MRFSTVSDNTLRDMGEAVNKIWPEPEDDLKNASEQGCDGLNDLSGSSCLDVSVVKDTDSLVTDSASIHDNSIMKTKKKYKKKGKNSKCRDNVVSKRRPNKIDQEMASFQLVMEGTGTLKVDDVTTNCDGTVVKCQKSIQTIPAADTAPFFACEPIADKCSCSMPSDLAASHVLVDTRNSSSVSSGDTLSCVGGSNVIMEEAPLGDLSQCSSCGTDSIISSSSEICSSGSNVRTKSNIWHDISTNTHADAVDPSKQNCTIQGDIVNKSRYRQNVKTRKASSNLAEQKSRKNYRDAPNHGAKRLNHIYVRKDVKLQDPQRQEKHNSCSGDGLLPTPTVSSSEHNAYAHPVTNSKQRVHGRTHCNLLVESSRWVAQKSCDSDCNQFISELRQGDAVGNKDWGHLKEKRKFSYKYFNTNKRAVAGYKENLLGFQNRIILSSAEVLKVSGHLHRYDNRRLSQRSIKTKQFTKTDESNCLHSYPTSPHVQLNMPQMTISGVSDCTFLPRLQPCMSMNIPRAEHVLDKNSSCYKQSYVDYIRQDSKSRVNSWKWIPVGRKDSEILENVNAVYVYNSLKDTCVRKAKVLHEENLISVSTESTDPGKAFSMSIHGIPAKIAVETERTQSDKIHENAEDTHRVESPRDHIVAGNKANTTSQFFIGSQMATKVLDAAYRLQIMSESIQVATGSPLAEFENLLQSATPLIAPACTLQHCSVCLDNQLRSRLLCKCQTTNIPLNDIWSWYEKPGNYGLEVKAEDSRNLKGLDVDTVSFNAHFVPFLSAIQLFCHSQKFSCDSSKGHTEYRVPENGEGEKRSSPSKTLRPDRPCPGEVEPDNLKGKEICVSNLHELAGEPDDMELVFEFYEYDQPQQRKPLYDKVMELVKAGTSSCKMFGDPSSLDCMYLQNLHPASWYSVAWYPIYRIPEGNFRASFLTYHSLGHLAQRFTTDSNVKNQSWVVCPVLGLQSYNAQGECWFNPKMPAESSPSGSMHCNSSEILEERLRTLEETARIISRGTVFKDHVKVTNRQPDYEFFLSRKYK